MQHRTKYMVKPEAPVVPTVVGHPLDVLLHAAENESDSLPWLRTQNKGCETRMLHD